MKFGIAVGTFLLGSLMISAATVWAAQINARAIQCGGYLQARPSVLEMLVHRDSDGYRRPPAEIETVAEAVGCRLRLE